METSKDLRTYTFQRMAYGGHLEIFKLKDIPSTIRFSFIEKLNENQQSWLVVVPNTEESIPNFYCLAANKYVMGDYSFIILNNVRPLSNDLPVIEFKDLYPTIIDKIKGLYITEIGRNGTVWSIYKILDFNGLKLKCAQVLWNKPHIPKDYKIISIDWYDLQLVLSNQSFDSPITSAGSYHIVGEDAETVFNESIENFINLIKQ